MAFRENPSQSYGASPAIWDRTVLLSAWHRWMHPALTQAKQAGTLPRMEEWVDFGG